MHSYEKDKCTPAPVELWSSKWARCFLTCPSCSLKIHYVNAGRSFRDPRQPYHFMIEGETQKGKGTQPKPWVQVSVCCTPFVHPSVVIVFNWFWDFFLKIFFLTIEALEFLSSARRAQLRGWERGRKTTKGVKSRGEDLSEACIMETNL